LTKYSVLLSRTSLNFLLKLDEKTKSRIKKSLKELETNPFLKRPCADIKQLSGSRDPVFYRMRIGNYRIIYAVEGKNVKITEIITREKGFEWMN